MYFRIKMTNSIVRKMNEQDAEEVAELFGNSFPEHIMVQRGFLNSPDYLKQRLQNPDECWMVEENGSVRGVAALATAPPVGLGEIERVCVAKEHRGNGIAFNICKSLVEEAKSRELGFVEAFARGNEPAMQRTFDKLGFSVWGVSPRFEVMHNEKVVRELFVHMGLILKPESVDYLGATLIPPAQDIYDKFISRCQEPYPKGYGV